MGDDRNENQYSREVFSEAYFLKFRCLEAMFKDLIQKVYFIFWNRRLPNRRDFELLNMFVTQPKHLRHAVCYKVLTHLLKLQDRNDLKHEYYSKIKYFLRKFVRIIGVRYRSKEQLNISRLSVNPNFLTSTRHGSLENINKCDGKQKLLIAEGDVLEGFIRISKIVRKLTGVAKRGKKRYKRVSSWDSRALNEYIRNGRKT